MYLNTYYLNTGLVSFILVLQLKGDVKEPRDIVRKE